MRASPSGIGPWRIFLPSIYEVEIRHGCLNIFSIKGVDCSAGSCDVRAQLTKLGRSIVKSFAVGTLLMGLLSVASAAHAQVANSQTDVRDYEVLSYLPKDTLAAIAYFR